MKILNYIDGRLCEPAGDSWLDNPEPATGAIYSQAADSDDADLDAAVAAASRAFPAWSQTPAEQRSRYLSGIADLIERDADSLAMDESMDTGKPVSLAQSVDIPRASANLRFFAAAATQFSSESHAMESGAINYTLRQPHGVVACISPWNLPLYLLTWKIAPALAAGNCVIAKPSEVTPLTAFRLSELCIEAGLPAGVLNIVHGTGPGVGQKIVDHEKIHVISFTGGSATGEKIAASAAPKFKKLSLELGGKNPTIVFADCDWDAMMKTSVRAAFANQGQICLCGSRILVEKSIYERFCDEFVQRASQIVCGDPMEKSTRHGAVASEAHMNKVLACIDIAREEGGNILCGGQRIIVDSERCRDGWFIAPTVIDGLGPDCRTNQEEIFGPVVTIMPFESEDEAVAIANGTNYGLAASVWCNDVTRCHRIANNLQSGLIWINTWLMRDLRTPMGGMKHSGVGREGGFEVMRFFTEPKNVCIAYKKDGS